MCEVTGSFLARSRFQGGFEAGMAESRERIADLERDNRTMREFIQRIADENTDMCAYGYAPPKGLILDARNIIASLEYRGCKEQSQP